MTETIISKSSIDEKIPEDRNYSKTNIFTKLLFLLKNNNSEKIKKWKNKINHFVDAQARFDQGSSYADGDQLTVEILLGKTIIYLETWIKKHHTRVMFST